MCRPPRWLCLGRAAPRRRLRLHGPCSDVPPASRAMPPPWATLQHATRLEGYASTRHRVDDITSTGHATTRRLTRGLCLGGAAPRGRRRLHGPCYDTSPASRAMPQRDDPASMTLTPSAMLRCTVCLKGHASVGRPRNDDFASTGHAPTRCPPQKLYQDKATSKASLLEDLEYSDSRGARTRAYCVRSPLGASELANKGVLS